MRPRIVATLLDLLWPPVCAACEEPAWDADAGVGLCRACAERLEPPCVRCARCARPVGPFALEQGCRRCEGERWELDGIVTAHAYRGTARALVVALKFGGVRGAARPLGRTLADALHARGIPGDLLVPVPLSRRRRCERGYNQAGLLARELSRQLGVDLDERALTRTRHDAPQSAQAPGRRRRGPRGAFRAEKARIEGRCVLLVDDVLTSGATALACAAALRRAGAASVVAAVACRAERHPGAQRRASGGQGVERVAP